MDYFFLLLLHDFSLNPKSKSECYAKLNTFQWISTRFLWTLKKKKNHTHKKIKAHKPGINLFSGEIFKAHSLKIVYRCEQTLNAA